MTECARYLVQIENKRTFSSELCVITTPTQLNILSDEEQLRFLKKNFDVQHDDEYTITHFKYINEITVE